MGTYTQRKRFDHPSLAEREERFFHHPEFKSPGVEVATRIAQADGECWLYLTQTGPLVDDDSMILPDWEKVG